MNIDMSQFYQVFFEETAEHLAAMEALLLGLDVGAPELDDLNAIFRAAHSIKGSSGTFGFTDMTAVTHELETLLDKLRKQEMAPTPAMVDAFLRAGDVIKSQLEAHRDGATADPAAASEIGAELAALASGGAVAVRIDVPPSSSERHIEFVPDDPKQKLESLFAALRELGEVNVLQQPESVPKSSAKSVKGKRGAGARKSKAVPQPWRISLTTSAEEKAIRDCFEFVVDPQSVLITAVPPPPAEDRGYGFFTDLAPASETPADPGYGFFDDVPIAAAAIQPDPGYGFFTDVKPVVSPPRNAGRRQTDDPGLPAAAAGRRPEDKIAVSSQVEATSIRVGVEKVDQLINLVGELVITQSMLAQSALLIDPVVFEKLVNGLGQLERNTRSLQEAVMSIRMMPISFVFSRYPRVVRDLAAKLGKEVELKTEGETTELDKGLIEKIADPLTHLVRNSLDHGIESPEQRVAAGKPAKGTITLRAFHQGGNIIIEVNDDGAGLSRERILAKARERGMAVTDALSDQEVWQLIFEAGFSTAAVVTDVSGRGVGMDVVKRNIHALGGRVEIESALGHGTRVAVRLPLTLAILDGLSVEVGGEMFIVPLAYIIESLQPAEGDVKTVAGQGCVVHVRGEYLPVVALHAIFNLKPKIKDVHRGIVVILEAEGRKTALFVDALVGQHQVVIKSLESNYRRVHGVSGATIMGDGKVALILDAVALGRTSRPATAETV
jgi:two-component system chemotaxis sensor kinase CheA